MGIGISGNKPVNSANQLLFAGYPGGDTTATCGAASGLNPTTLATFNGNDYDSMPGAYRISLAGVTFGTAVSAVRARELGAAAAGLRHGRLRRRPQAGALSRA